MGNMAADQRRDVIRRMLAEDPSVSQQSIAAELGVSQNTISKDLRVLEERDGLNLRPVSGRGRPRSTVTKLHANAGSSPGEDLVAKIRADMTLKNLEPDAREEGLLLQIRQVADDIAELRGRIAAEGLTFPAAVRGGPPRMHPAAAEIRQSRAVLARLLPLIQLEDTVRNPVKQRAANMRWRAHNLALAARYRDPGDGE
jgi:biotin operon repressor